MKCSNHTFSNAVKELLERYQVTEDRNREKSKKHIKKVFVNWKKRRNPGTKRNQKKNKRKEKFAGQMRTYEQQEKIKTVTNVPN